MGATALGLLESLQPFVYAGVAFAAFVQWRRHPSPASAWLLAAFSVLGAAVVGLGLLPDDSNGPLTNWALKGIIAALPLFPYCLYRFMSCLIPASRWMKMIAVALTVAVAIGALALPPFPEGSGPTPLWFEVYFGVLIVQWVSLSGVVVVRLWRAGRGQPSVARWRMRTLSVGAGGLAAALVVAVEFSDGSGSQLLFQLLVLLAAPLMLIGFSPPAVLRLWWRRSEDASMRKAELSLMEATTTPEIADALLPLARRLVGAGSAILETSRGVVVARDGPGGPPHGVPQSSSGRGRSPDDASLVRVPMRSHRLTIVASPFTPFFGREELEILEGLAGLADLALARNALLENQRLLAAIVETTDDAVVARTLDGTITSWNRGAETMYGYRSEEVVGKALSMLVPPDVQNDLEADLERVRQGHHVTQYETKRRTKDGRILDVALTVSSLQDSTGKIVGSSTIARDVTERKEMVQRLQRSEEQLRTAQGIAGIGSWISDIETGRATWSDELYQILGVSPEIVDPPHGFATFVHPDDLQAFRDAMTRARESHEPFILEFRIIRPDGSERTVEARGAVAVESGRAVSISGTMQDVTERRTVERERETARAEAERANRAKSDFLSRMSHELRTPLNAVLGFAQLLDMDDLSADQRESTTEIIKAGKHLLTLINDVLDVAGIEAGRLRLSLEPVDAIQAIKECISLLAPAAREAGVTVSFDEGTASPRHISADQQRFKQVVLNLLSNGIKYNRQDGRVDVSVEPIDDRRVRIDVADTGLGIPADRIQQLFLPFERLGAEVTGIEGAGLGLALSKSLVEVMGGSISLRSEPGRGTTFSVELPAVDSAAMATEDSERYELEPEGHPTPPPVTILYVEDNLSNLKLVERLLARRPHVKMLSAMQASLGLTLARDHRPDVVFLDLGLPDMPGSELLERLRADPRTTNIPVVVVSASATSGRPTRLLESGARAYLTKPIDVPRFYEILDEIAAEGRSGGTEPKG